MINHVANAIIKNKDFLQLLKDGTNKFQSSEELQNILNTNKRKIKVFKDDENDVIYIIDKTIDETKVYREKIHDFNKNKKIEEILYWDLEKVQDRGFKIYNQLVVKFSNSSNFDNKENLTKFLNENVQDSELLQKLTENFERLKKTYGEDDMFQTLSKFECSSDCFVIKDFMDFLNNKKIINQNYSDTFYLDLNKKVIKENQSKIENWIITINAMTNSCIQNGYTTNSPFEFNDADNCVFVNDNKLVLTDQNIGFYFDTLSEKSFNIYFFDKENNNVFEEIYKIENKLKNKENLNEQIVVKVQDGKILQINGAYLECLELDMDYSKRAMINEKVLEINYPVDITSYEYQKNYYHHCYGLNEFEFIAQSMMTLGGGFDYDSKKGAFINDRVKYIENLKEAPNTREQPVKNFKYLYPTDITNLNKDWLDAIKYAVDVLKNDRPVPMVFNKADVHESLDSAIEYYENKIKKIESNNSLKPKM